MSDNIRLIKLREAAEMLGVNPETLRRWDRKGILKAIKFGARGDRRYDAKDLQNFIKNNKAQK
ncbi:MAG: DNA-binding protein, excisionase family [candidate division WS6 bacterium GW2011_GWE1_34_7]|uniref:DNA-binding protein, excisionase family n=1 Tax=candidate division WS6 bacterium GW2011_GWE1_34_7 TaxID=1619093 RepID=A0A0G0BM27_9BACT|nr:MAG: DNA-binding protein, excisionase family [candidate division WS6 bacterium GW2011_GWE1_34_7]